MDPISAPIPGPFRQREGAGSCFVGRSRELGAIRAALAHAAAVTLVGPPGVGKTRTALELAREQPDALFCDLTPARTSLEVLQRLSHSLGGSADTASLRAALRSRPLVILDNCEQAVGAVSAAIDAFGGACPLLLTSRAPIGHPSEQVIDLGPLPEDDAVRLLIQRARAASNRFDPEAHPASILTELARALDGLPLAIEMAAARTRVLSPAQLLARLSDPLALLRGRAGRWDSIEAAIAWSWELLTEHQRSALAQCSVFEGGFDLTAAEAVVDLPPGAPSVLDLLGELERASLLGVAAVPELEGELRFQHYPCIREFAALHRPDGVELRHARHYVDRFDTVSEASLPRSRPEWIHLSAELANLQAARRAAWGEEPQLAVRAALAISEVAIHSGPAALGVEVLTDALLASAEPKLRLLGLLHRGMLRSQISEPVVEDLEAGLALARELGDLGSEAMALCNLGLWHSQAGRYAEAEALYRQSAEAGEAAGKPSVASAAWSNIASMQLGLQGVDSRDAVQRSISAAERSGEPVALAWALLRLADLEQRYQRFSAADQAIRRALPHAREAGRDCLSRTLFQAGVLWHLLGQLDEAREALDEAETAVRSMHVAGTGMVWCSQALLAATTGDLPRARRLATDATALHERLGARSAAQWACLILALVSLEEERGDDAAARIAEVRASATARPLQIKAHLMATATSPLPEAEAALAQATALGAPPSSLAVGEAWLAARSGDAPRAEALLDTLPEIVEPTVATLRRVLRRRIRSTESDPPEDGLLLVLRYESVHIHRSRGPVVVIVGYGARILTDLAQMGAPTPWSLLAREIWGAEVDEVSLRRRWDTTISRLRARLRDEGVRSSLLHTDRRGNVELVLSAADAIDDQS